ncbi:hypothetical protein HYFRA_00013338 [Hymenoscyphus fraxineus]|uniref:Chromo domain-containing protein n=1 Tax=Hymenoscyphus fraxineus TaxID=746836 RepID=A0A9N9L6P2_9HELO|nr:hypothetical protein HYFRA_00013338 [Hymenoscyphus fraxineus]
MEREGQRVEEERSKRSKSKSITTFTRDPPLLSSPAKKKKPITKDKSAESDPVYWKINSIQEEKISKGTIWYLIDWADHPVTGEVYPSDWQPADNVTEAAIREWDLRKIAQEPKREKRLSQDPSSPTVPTSASKTTGAVNRKRNRKRSLTPPQQKKKPRKAGTSETARFQSVSLENHNSQERPTEIKDSYEEPSSSATSVRVVYQARVEIPPIPKTFNRAAYSPVPLSSSQPSEKYSQNLSDTTQSQLQTQSQTFDQFSSSQQKLVREEVESSDEELPQPLVRRPARSRKVLREEVVVIPDSQDTGSSPTFKAALQADTRSSDLSAAAQYSSREEATVASESQPGTRPFALKTPSGSVEDPISHSQLSESRPHSYPGAENPFQGEETGPALPVKPVQQEPSLESQEFQTQVPFSTQTNDSTESGNGELVLTESDASHLIPVQESAGTESQQRQPSGSASLVPSLQAVSETVLRSSESAPQSWSQSHSISRPVHLQAVTKDIDSLHANCDTASESSPTSPQSNSPVAVRSRSQTVQYRQQSSPIQSDSVVQPSSDASTKDTSARQNSSSFESLSREDKGKVAKSGLVQSIERASEPLSPSKMEDFSDASQDTRALLKAARMKAVEKRMAERLAARSTSTLPATPPAPEVPSQPLPLRETIPPPSPKTSERASEEPEFDAIPKTLVPLQDGDCLIPLPLMASIRDGYVQTIKNNKQARLDFIEYGNDAEVVERIDMMLDELEKQCDHPDLNADDYTSQRELPPEIQGRYAETVSTKCFFVGELIRAMRESDKHLVILSRPGRMLEILQGLLIRHQFSKRVGDGNTYFPTAGSLRVTLLGLDYEEREEQSLEPASLVVVFSPSSNLSRYSALRRNPASLTLAPLASLVITHSIEHLNLCIDQATPPNERYFLLINFLSQIQDQVGKLDSEHPLIEETALDLAASIMDDSQRLPVWGLPPIDVSSFASRSTPSHPSNQVAGAMMGPDGSATNNEVASAKRQFNVEENALDARKRQKLFEGHDQPDMTAPLAPLMIDANTDCPQHSQRIRELMKALEEKDEIMSQKSKLNINLGAEIVDLKRGITIIYPKFQESLNDAKKCSREADEAKKSEEILRRKYDALVSQHDQLKAQKAAVDTQLAAAREESRNSSDPLVAEMSRVNEKNTALQAEIEKLKKQRDSDAKELEFIRNQYQDASSAAGEANAKNRSLEAEVVELRKRADENSVLIHQIAKDTAVDQYTDAIRALQGENAELNNELKRAYEDSRQRRVRTTRGASTPRSPRMAPGTMSPRNIGRTMGGSRAGSPAPGEPNRGNFSEGSAVFKQWGRFQ